MVKTREHREALWALTDEESEELGPFLRKVSAGIVDGLGAARVYVTMWVDKPPHHVHFVVYPRWPERVDGERNENGGAMEAALNSLLLSGTHPALR